MTLKINDIVQVSCHGSSRCSCIAIVACPPTPGKCDDGSPWPWQAVYKVIKCLYNDHSLYCTGAGEDESVCVVLGSAGGTNTDGKWRAQFRGQYLAGVSLCSANLERADLCYVDFSDAYIQGANLMMADLHCAILRGAHFDGTLLAGAHITYADLHRADLTDADLTDANLEGADLRGVTLCETDLSGVNLTGAIIDNGRGGVVRMTGYSF